MTFTKLRQLIDDLSMFSVILPFIGGAQDKFDPLGKLIVNGNNSSYAGGFHDSIRTHPSAALSSDDPKILKH